MAALGSLLGLRFLASIKSDIMMVMATMQGMPVEMSRLVPLPGARPQIPEGKRPTQYNASRTKTARSNLYMVDWDKPFLTKYRIAPTAAMIPATKRITKNTNAVTSVTKIQLRVGSKRGSHSPIQESTKVACRVNRKYANAAIKTPIFNGRLFRSNKIPSLLFGCLVYYFCGRMVERSLLNSYSKFGLYSWVPICSNIQPMHRTYKGDRSSSGFI